MADRLPNAILSRARGGGSERCLDEDEPSSWVYFIEAVGADAVKIGVSTSVRERLGDLQGANCSPLRLLLLVAGDRTVEQRLHALMRAHRIQGEWFANGPPMREVLKSLARHDCRPLCAACRSGRVAMLSRQRLRCGSCARARKGYDLFKNAQRRRISVGLGVQAYDVSPMQLRRLRRIETETVHAFSGY